MSDDTLRPGDTAKAGDTAKIGDTVQVGGGATATAATSGVVLAQGHPIVLNGKNCTIEKRFKTSGEAVVYTVKIDNKTYIFKHYKPNMQLSDTAKEVLSRIKNSPHDRIIKLIDFGKYENQDYELMEFAEGGTLSEYLQKKGALNSPNQLKGMVKMINEGLRQMHGTYNFIYQDLKPDNIIFKDGTRKEIVLADFGISSIMETNEKKATVVASQTGLYGAPELSLKPNQKEAIVTPVVDYFSLGIAMIEMWLGEKPFKNITETDRVYQISAGNVDLPADMPDDCKTLIQGLIKYNWSDRWGDKQIQQWLKGETLQVSGKSNLAYTTEMFSDTENFSSPKELADLMVKHPDQGAKLLYSGIVEKWFEKSGMSLRAEDIKEITTTYAQDKQSGLYTAIYKLDPARPWTSKGGKSCTNLEEIAQALMSESAYYMEELKKPNARLYLYIKAVEGAKGNDVADAFLKVFIEFNPQRALSLVCLRLQSDQITIGSKKYASPDELTQEKDSTQIDLIKKEIMEDDSFLLVWLSSLYKNELPSSSAFGKQPPSGQFFLMGMFPNLSLKELDLSWQKHAARILLGFIKNSPGRADLFEAYVAQGLPLNIELGGEARNMKPIYFIVDTFDDFMFEDRMMDAPDFEKEYQDGTTSRLDLIRLLVKLGADVNANPNTLSRAVNQHYVPLVKLLLDLGASKEAIKIALKNAPNPKGHSWATEINEIIRLLKKAK